MRTVDDQLAELDRARRKLRQTACVHCGHTHHEHASWPTSRPCQYPRVRTADTQHVKPCRCKQFIDPATTLEAGT